ncbi:hypothetical protein [Methylobacter tundripaludum]|uniref:hypothetical protein n=1 Tax=Methylobacter tundripaludum TaxID=173365 RepID=UPI0004DF4D93|nr:hypothetical protein [Methylobacter tundripaludum]
MNAGRGYNKGTYMLNVGNKSIAQALFVIGFPRDSTIRTKQFDIEKALAPLFDGSSVNTNLPDDFNPLAPRVTLQQKQVSAIFSQVTAQLTIDIDNTNGKSTEVIRDSVAKKINLFQSGVDKIIPQQQQRERGLVLTVLYPVDSTQFSDEVVSAYIQSTFFQISPLGEPASTQFNVGYKTKDNYFVTLSVGQYQTFAGDTKDLQPNQWLDIKSLPVSESGIELKIDINSRPLVDQSVDVTNVILKKAFDFAIGEADKFIGVQK